MVDSTNLAAQRALRLPEALPAGTVFLADEQTAGRGQGGNRWHATAGANLTLSVVAYPDHLAVDRLFALTQFTALAVMETVRKHLPDPLAADVRVKWPNDVLVGERKIAGILVQNALRGPKIQSSLIGIGLNVNEKSFPDSLAQRATSLRLLKGEAYDRDAVQRTLFEAIERYYALTFKREGQLARAYHDWLFGREKPRAYRIKATGQSMSALVKGVKPDGRLQLVSEEGEYDFANGEISVL